jgi:hypothetical protein
MPKMPKMPRGVYKAVNKMRRKSLAVLNIDVPKTPPTEETNQTI